MYEISKLTKRDLNGLSALYKDAFGSSTNIERMEQTFDEISKQSNHIILCAKEKGTIVGSVLGVVCCELIGNCTPFMVLEDLAVLKSYRRLGVATQLLKEIEVRAKQQHCNMILFVSSDHRKGAHKLYESLGFGADKVNGYRKRIG